MPMNKVLRDSVNHYLSCRNPISFVVQFGIYLYMFRVMLSGCWAGSRSCAIQFCGTLFAEYFYIVIEICYLAFLIPTSN